MGVNTDEKKSDREVERKEERGKKKEERGKRKEERAFKHRHSCAQLLPYIQDLFTWSVRTDSIMPTSARDTHVGRTIKNESISSAMFGIANTGSPPFTLAMSATVGVITPACLMVIL